MKFILEIELGNEAMHTHNDIVKKLKEVAADIKKLSKEWSEGEEAVYSIRDINGNRVGKWEFSK